MATKYYNAVAHATTPFVTIYGQDGGVSTKVANPATLPAGRGTGASFSADLVYLAVSHDVTPFITIYKRSGDTFTKLADPATLPAAAAFGAVFSPDGVYLAVVQSITPFITIYKRSGDTFTKLADPAALPSGAAYGAAFSPDGVYLSIAHNNSPFITIYKRSGDTFTKLADPATLPTGVGQGVSFSPDGVYLSIAHGASPSVTIYKRSGDTFTKLADPATLPAGVGRSTAFSADGTYLTVGHDATPFVTIYKRSGDVFTKLANPAALPSGAAYGAAFSPDGIHLSAAHNLTPFVTIYSRAGDAFTKLANPATLPAGVGYGDAYSPSLNVAPNAPTLTAPVGNVTIDRAVTQRFGWTASDPDAGDSQSQYDGQYRLIGAPSFTAFTGTTPNQFHDFVGGTFAAGSYEWQVRTYDALGLVGPYSASAFFTAASTPATPTLTAPINNETIAAQEYTATWSAPSQDAFQIRTVADGAGGVADPAIVYTDSGTVESSTARSRLLTFAVNNRQEHVQVRVRVGGLWSTYTSARVLVSFTPPAVPGIAVAASSPTASITVTLTNPTPGGGQPTVSYLDLYRREGGVGDGIRIAKTLPAGVYSDNTPASGVGYDYRAVAVATNGTTSTSAWTT